MNCILLLFIYFLNTGDYTLAWRGARPPRSSLSMTACKPFSKEMASAGLWGGRARKNQNAVKEEHVVEVNASEGTNDTGNNNHAHACRQVEVMFIWHSCLLSGSLCECD